MGSTLPRTDTWIINRARSAGGALRARDLGSYNLRMALYLNRATIFGTPILLFDGSESPPELPKYRWIHLANEGLYKGHHQGEFNLTRAVFETFIRNLRDNPQYLAGKLDDVETSADGTPRTYTGGIRPVLQYDYEHASEMPGSSGSIPDKGAPAMGWVLDLALREGANGKAQLWAFTQLSDQIRAQIRANQYRWVSIAFNSKGIHWVTGLPIGPVLTSVAFTNHSFMQDLESLAAANRGASADDASGLKPVHDPSEAPDAVTSLQPTGASMSDPLRERICKTLQLRNLAADDAAVGDAVEQAVAAGGDLKSLLEALGVPNVDEALKSIPALRSAREKMAGMLGEMDSLLQQDSAADAAIAKVDVGAAMKSQNFVGEGAAKALGAMRTQCVNEEVKKLGEAPTLSALRDARAKGRAHFLTEYNVKETSSGNAHLGRTLVAGAGGTQVVPPTTPLVIDERADGSIDLRGIVGANVTEKLITHLSKTEPGFDKLPYDRKIQRASAVRRTALLTQ